MIAFQIPILNEWMLWDHSAILTGQVWRIVTGNFTHTNLYHLGMNLIGLWLICYIFKPELRVKSFSLIVACLSFSVGTLLLITSMQIYVGLSGVLHGLFACYALTEYRKGNKNSLWLVLGLIIKIAWEQAFGSPTGSEALIGASVAINAHLFGCLTGFTLSFILFRPSQLIRQSKNS
ncbi:rhombosortase [Vibrio rumoiensis]|nr:rhombosortase [Vibrio rumoiensis]